MRWGFLWLFLPSLPRAVNTNQMLMPPEISRLRSLFAILRHPAITSLSQAVFLVCFGVHGAFCTFLPASSLVLLFHFLNFYSPFVFLIHFVSIQGPRRLVWQIWSWTAGVLPPGQAGFQSLLPAMDLSPALSSSLQCRFAPST